MTNCNMCNFLIKARSLFHIDYNEDNKETKLKAYQSFIEKLMYLTCSIKPNILFIIGQLERHNLDPRISHM